MNSRLMTVVALLLLGAALIAAFAGYQLSQQSDPLPVQAEPAETPPAPELPAREDARTPVLFAARDLAVGAILRPEDLRIERLSVVPPNAFSDEVDVVGRLLVAPVRRGEPLLDTRFFKASQLARTLRPGERAIAVAVDDVVGAGGFIAPGDHVDLLLYLKENHAGAGGRESAQVVVPDLRVLSYELHLDLPPDGVEDEGAVERGGQQRRTNRTAVLAVPEEEGPKVVLAANAGSLRLALRGADERMAEALDDSAADGPFDPDRRVRRVAEEAVRFTTIEALRPPASSPPPAARRPVNAPKPGVIIHRGLQVVEVKP